MNSETRQDKGLELTILADGVPELPTKHWESSSQHLRGVSTTRLGHFVLLEELGRGGMGEVYSAYDPNLDRRVALKILRPRSRSRQGAQQARARLLREAQALGRLSHPNVVPVHEVGMLEDRVFVVMEFVAGQTLRSYAREEQRTWQEIIAVYLQAAEGLSVAHEAGVVHRDFKPDNAIVGTDQRVRVIDFGLARDLGEHPFKVSDALAAMSQDDGNSPRDADAGPRGADPSGAFAHADVPKVVLPATRSEEAHDGDAQAGDEGDWTNTETRALLGTPAYMSPEQFQSAQVGPSTDQFSFCVALYEALYGRRPFVGKTLAELREQVLNSEPGAPKQLRGVPSYVHAVLLRSLAKDPDERYPSMRALASALARDPRRQRRRSLAAALGAVMLVAFGYGLYWYGAQAPAPDAAVCQGGQRELARVWNPERRQQVRAAIEGTGNPYAAEAWPLVTKALDGYGGRWVAVRQDACMAHRDGVQSGELLDRRMGCLERRLGAMERGVGVLAETTPATLPKVVDVALKLPAIDDCANSPALMADVALPESPERASMVNEERSQLDRAHALEHVGRYDEALALVEQVATRVDSIDYAPLTAEVDLTQGRIRLWREDRRGAVAPLERAALTGLAAGIDALALEALARLIYARGTMDSDGASQALLLAPYGEALSRRQPVDEFAHALLLNNVGVVHLSMNHREQAREQFERATAVLEAHPEARDIELIFTLQNLAMVTEDRERRQGLLQQAIEQLQARLGSNHYMVLHARETYSHFVADPQQASAILTPTCEAYQTFFAEHGSLAMCRRFQGYLSSELEQREQAARLYQQTADMTEAILQQGHQEDADRGLYLLARGLALFHRGSYQRAHEALVEASSVFDRMGVWWLQDRLVESRLATGACLLALGHTQEAIAGLRSTLEVAMQQTRLADDVGPWRQLAATQWQLARALIAAEPKRTPGVPCRSEPLELLRAAQVWYRSAGGYHARLIELARVEDSYLSQCQVRE